MMRKTLHAAPRLRQAAGAVGEVRNRLDYVVHTCGEAATRVLNDVDQARAEQEQICAAVSELRRAAAGNPLAPVVERLAGLIEASSRRTRDQLTDILLAQGFHDLIGQMVGKVSQLVNSLKDNPGTAPVAAAGSRANSDALTSPELVSPAGNAHGRDEVLTNQEDVDTLLAKTRR